MATNFLLNSDYPLDKVIYLETGSFTVPASSTYLHSVAHNLPFIPLLGGNWSLSSDFSVSYEYSTGTFPSTNPAYPFDQTCNIFADSTHIYISVDNLNASSKTFYFRAYGFQLPDDTSDIDPIGGQGDNFLLNTDYNYTKLLLSGSVNTPSTMSTGVPENVAVEHDLGYIPQATGWITYDTYNGTSVVTAIHPFGTSNSASQNVLMSINSTHINFSVPAFTDAHTAYYRLYLDE